MDQIMPILHFFFLEYAHVIDQKTKYMLCVIHHLFTKLKTLHFFHMYCTIHQHSNPSSMQDD